VAGRRIQGWGQFRYCALLNGIVRSLLALGDLRLVLAPQSLLAAVQHDLGERLSAGYSVFGLSVIKELLKAPPIIGPPLPARAAQG
jgi:hypothetical protein